MDALTLLTPAEWEIIGLSLKVAAWSVACSLPPALAVALLLARRDFRGKSLLDAVVHLPLVLPPVVVGYLLLLTFGVRGPIGALLMKDEAGGDEKIIAVPVDKLHPFYRGIESYLDLPEILRDQIAHFFQHYKDLEKGKWVTIVEWVGPAQAKALIMDAIAAHNAQKK